MLLILLSLFLPDTCIQTGHDYVSFFNAQPVSIKYEKMNACHENESSTDTSTTYDLYKENSFSIKLQRRFTTLNNDYFIINGRYYEFLKSASNINKQILLYKEAGNFYLETCKYYLVETAKGRKYFIFEGSVQGAAGNMSALIQYFVVDYTNNTCIKCYDLQSFSNFEYSFLDINNDGFLDFSLFKDLNSPKDIEITNYSLNTFKALAIRHKIKWRATWEGCLAIKQ